MRGFVFGFVVGEDLEDLQAYAGLVPVDHEVNIAPRRRVAPGAKTQTWVETCACRPSTTTALVLAEDRKSKERRRSDCI